MTGYVRKTLPVPIMSAPTTPDWADIVMHLIRHRCTKLRIATACGMTREKIYSILRGCYEPTFSEGHRLLALCDYVEEFEK